MMERRHFIAGSAMAALSVTTLPIMAAASVPVDRRKWDTAFSRCMVAREHYDACVARLRRLYGRAVSAPMDEQTALDDLCEQMGERESDLMDTPAPDLAALRWKLDHLREADGTMVPWSASYIEQAYLDIARLLPPSQ